MNDSTVHYDLETLRRLLDDQLSEPLASDIAGHLADCAPCRERFERLAEGDGWWSGASDSARLILAQPEAYESQVDEWSDVDSPWSEARFLHQFAIDFLTPSDQPNGLGRLEEFEIVELIGRGGMGIVLKGYQPELKRFVAVKVLAPQLAVSGAARRRFAREAQAAAAVVNPHVMAIHAVRVSGKLPFLVMPYVACESLQQRLDRQGPLELVDALRIGMQAAQGLAAAHAQGLVHRDVKPGNILLETSVDRVMLTDFGLARAVDDATLTRTGIIAGTPLYMSPEQAAGEPVDARSDLFSLGSVLFAMAAGRPPFRAETTFGVLSRIRESQPALLRHIRPELPAWYDAIIGRLLAKSRDERFETAEEVARLLASCLAHVQQPDANRLPDALSNVVAHDATREVATVGCESVGGEHAEAPRRERPGFLRSLARHWPAVALTCVVCLGLALTARTWLTSWFASTPSDHSAQGGHLAPRAGDERVTRGETTSNSTTLEWESLQAALDNERRAIERIEMAAERESLSEALPDSLTPTPNSSLPLENP